MTGNKTQPSSNTVAAYIATLTDAKRQADSTQLVTIMQRASGMEPVMWGTSIIGFGTRHYVYESGRKGDMMIVGFSARAQALVLYGLMHEYQTTTDPQQLGQHTTGKGCIYIKDLSQVNIHQLERMITAAFSAA